MNHTFKTFIRVLLVKLLYVPPTFTPVVRAWLGTFSSSFAQALAFFAGKTRQRKSIILVYGELALLSHFPGILWTSEASSFAAVCLLRKCHCWERIRAALDVIMRWLGAMTTRTHGCLGLCVHSCWVQCCTAPSASYGERRAAASTEENFETSRFHADGAPHLCSCYSIEWVWD